MAEMQKDLLGLQYSPNFQMSDIQEAVVNLTLDTAHDVETTVSGTVTDGDTPIEGATVKIFDHNGTPFMHTTTGVEGKYSFENVPPGTYSIAVVKDGYRLSPSKAATLSAGDTAILDFSLTKDVTLSLGAVSGIVNTGEGNHKTPVGGVKLSLFNSSNNLVAVTYSVNDGEFAFYDLNDGIYTLVATAMGYNPSNPVQLTITNGSIVNTTITLVIDSETYRRTVNGVITNKQGQVVAGCFVGLYLITRNEDDTVQERLVARTKTNALGQYLFGNVDAGNYAVKAKLNA